MSPSSPENKLSQKIAETIQKDKKEAKEKNPIPKKETGKSQTPKEEEAEIAKEKAELEKNEALDREESARKTEEIMLELENIDEEGVGKEKPEKQGKAKKKNKGEKNKKKNEEKKAGFNLGKSFGNGIAKVKEVLKKFVGRPLSFLFWGLLLIITWAWEKIDKKGKK